MSKRSFSAVQLAEREVAVISDKKRRYLAQIDESLVCFPKEIVRLVVGYISSAAMYWPSLGQKGPLKVWRWCLDRIQESAESAESAEFAPVCVSTLNNAGYTGYGFGGNGFFPQMAYDGGASNGSFFMLFGQRLHPRLIYFETKRFKLFELALPTLVRASITDSLQMTVVPHSSNGKKKESRLAIYFTDPGTASPHVPKMIELSMPCDNAPVVVSNSFVHCPAVPLSSVNPAFTHAHGATICGCSDVPASTANHAFTHSHGALVCTGGMVSRTAIWHHDLVLKQCLFYHPTLASKRWLHLPSLPRGRGCHAMANLGGKLIVVGGVSWLQSGKDCEPCPEIISLDLTLADLHNQIAQVGNKFEGSLKWQLHSVMNKVDNRFGPVFPSIGHCHPITSCHIVNDNSAIVTNVDPIIQRNYHLKGSAPTYLPPIVHHIDPKTSFRISN